MMATDSLRQSLSPVTHRPESPYVVEPDLELSYGPRLQSFVSGDSWPCYVVFSPKSVFLNKTRIRAILGWATERSGEIVVVDGAYLGRWNLRALRGMSANSARAVAKKESARIRRRFENVIRDCGWSDHITLFNYEQSLQDSSFRDVHSRIKSLYTTDADFSALVSAEVGHFMERHSSLRDSLGFGRLPLLEAYVLEEIAVFYYLHSLGYEIELYPGPDLEVMKKIAASSYESLNLDLTTRTQIALVVRKQSG